METPPYKVELDNAIHEWCRDLGPEGVLLEGPLLDQYATCTIPDRRAIPAVLLPKTREDVAVLLAIANRHHTPIYPISTGNNWGYGSSSPVKDGCVIVDLSRMNQILSFDADLGLVTVEPGVTQGQLQHYLESHNLPFITPTTGAGPNCSLIGNALERGYGITPYADHFGAATWLEAVLPSGDIYRGALTDLGGTEVDRTHKWGLGPYIDGIFTQANLGIVTKMTFALARKQPHMLAFFFGLADDQLEVTVQSIQAILSSVGGITSSINLMNARRVLAMIAPRATPPVDQGPAIPDSMIKDVAKKHRLEDWTGIGAIYGEKAIVRAGRNVVRSKLGPHVKRLMFIKPAWARGLQRALGYAPWLQGAMASLFVDRLNESLRLLEGIPSEAALQLAYWKSGTRPKPGQALNPARDGCGLMWYAPLVPMKPDAVRHYVDMVTRVCLEHEIDPLITLTSLSDRCFDSTVPLLLDKGDVNEIRNANDCFKALYETGRLHGFLPYRLGIDTMHLFTQANTSSSQLIDKIKAAIDPNRIISPGRYTVD